MTAQSPGRNDECWCGSGKNKKCHLDFDERLEESSPRPARKCRRAIAEDPGRDRGIKSAAPGERWACWTTWPSASRRALPLKQIDQWVHDYTVGTAPFPRRSIMRASRVSVHLGQQRVVCHGIPLQTRCCARATSSTSTAPLLRRLLLRFVPHVLHRRGVAGGRPISCASQKRPCRWGWTPSSRGDIWEISAPP